MEQELLQLLADTQNPSSHPRKSAEHRLLTLYSNEAFALSLASIASHTSVPVPIRQSALLVLRTFVSAAWSSHLDEFKGQVMVDDANKAQIRRVLLELATSPTEDDRRVKASASMVVSKIAAADFPEDWPEVLPSLLQIIRSGTGSQLHGALRVLSDLVENGLREDQFFTVAQELVSTLFDVATNTTLKPTLRALAVSTFRACFDTLQMVIEQHKTEVRQFMDEALKIWMPFFIGTIKETLPAMPTEDEESADGSGAQQWRGIIALKLQIAKVILKVRDVFPGLLANHSTTVFSTFWDDLLIIQNPYQELYIHDERQGRMEDADNLPYTLDYLVLEELDLLQMLLRAPPVKAELDKQLQAAGNVTSGWVPELLKIATSYALVSAEDEGLWDIDVNLYLCEETSVTANYTPRTCGGDLIVKLGEWLKQGAAEALLSYSNILFSDPNVGWKHREAVLYLACQLLRHFHDVRQTISLELANGFEGLVKFCVQQEDIFLRARGYLVASIITKVADKAFHPTGFTWLEASVKAIREDPSEVVKTACVRVLQDYLPTTVLAPSLTQPIQVHILSTLSEFISSHDLRDITEGDDVKFNIAESLRDTILVEPNVVLNSIALDMLFNVASAAAGNYQLAMVVTETFELIIEHITEQGHEAYVRLCEKVLPPLTGAIDVGNMTDENSLISLATDLVRILTEFGLEPLPNGFIGTLLPKVNRLALVSEDNQLLPSATLAIKHMLAHDPNQFFAWQDPQTGKGAVETTLIIIDRLLGPTIDDKAASEVGELAATLVERAGAERLGPYFPQLLRAVAQRLATAEKPQLIQSLILVFARLSLISAQEVIDFLSQIEIHGQSGLQVVLAKWLENSVSFAGYEEIRQNVLALTKLYELADARIANVQVKGELIIQDTGRIKTRSMSRNNPDQYTIIPATLKIVKVLIEELSSAQGGRDFRPTNFDQLSSDDEDEDWEDMPSSILDLGLGITKQDLMGYGAEDGEDGTLGIRQRDDETQSYLTQFFTGSASKPEFQELFSALTPNEQEKLRNLS
ncbi:hypothetical protein FQN57_005043 [Myotisia sp. PD_48]|nr:hypothetical protein FQN57_005043 [Myotisia sp. PD_48]